MKRMHTLGLAVVLLGVSLSPLLGAERLSFLGTESGALGSNVAKRCNACVLKSDDDCPGERWSPAVKSCVCVPSGTCSNLT